MAEIAVFSAADGALIAQAVRAVLAEIAPLKLTGNVNRPTNNMRWITAGVLTSELSPGGSATFTLHRANLAGGMGSATGVTGTVVDVDVMEPDAEPFPIGTPIVAAWGGLGEAEDPADETPVWILIVARCPE